MAEKHGEKVVTEWRTSLTVPPPPLDRAHPSHPANNPLYRDIEQSRLPSSECLSDIAKRLQPLWEESIAKDIKRGKKVLVVAHGSSLRALIYSLMPGLKEEEIKRFNIPNAVPMIVSLDEGLGVTGIDYLGDESEIAVKMDKIKLETQKAQV